MKSKWIIPQALVAASALLLSACGGSDNGADPTSGPSDGQDSAPAAQGGEITVRGCTPQDDLIPGNANETCGSRIIDAISAKLVRYNDTGEPTLDIAEAIETEDSQVFTVKLKEGYKFHDGTDVLAHNFVDAWNEAAYGPNGRLGAYFFEFIEGYSDVQCGEEGDCEATPPTAETMSGLEVVDDLTFTITTSAPVSNLEVRLGYNVYAPLPDSFFDDADAYAESPIGAGPFKFVSTSTTETVLERFEDYAGEAVPNVDKVTFRVYDDPNSAYTDVVAGNLDATDVIPTDMLVGDQWLVDLEDRGSKSDTLGLQFLTFSSVDEQLIDNPDLKKAISRAIDRELIVQQIFENSVTPATGWVPPVVDGYVEGQCGENCDYDPESAKELYEQSGGYEGTFSITVNGDGGHDQWANAVCNQLNQNLGMDCVVDVTPDFATQIDRLFNDEIQGAFRMGWSADYPSIENFLTSIYVTDAYSNFSGYSNEEFDSLMQQANENTDLDAANELYAQAEALLADEMPTAPLWFPSNQFGWSSNVENVHMTPFGNIDLTQISTVS